MRSAISGTSSAGSEALDETYRQAAEAEGYKDHGRVWTLARKYGLVQAKKEQILAGSRRVALLANEELERRLVEKPDEFSDRDLVVAGGVAVDKLATAEGWAKDRDQPQSGQASLEDLKVASNLPAPDITSMDAVSATP